MIDADQHARAIAAGLEQCPFCELGWRSYSIDDTKFICVNCGEHSEKDTLARLRAWKTKMTSQIGHTRAMEQQLWQCPQCENGWQQYLVAEDVSECPNCKYRGGAIKSNVSTGAICHVSLRIDAKEALAAHDGELYKIISKIGDGKHQKQFDSLVAQEQQLHNSIDAARKKINDLAAIGLRTLFSMGDEPAMTPSDKLELRLVLCKVTE